MAEEEVRTEETQPEDVADTQEAAVEGNAVAKAEYESIVKRLEDAEAKSVALEKALALEELRREPICKGVGIEPEQVWALRKAEPEAAEFWIDKVVELHKQVTSMMVELGTSNAEEAPHDLVAKAEAYAKEHKVSKADAIIAVSKAEPELAEAYVRERQDAVARGGR